MIYRTTMMKYTCKDTYCNNLLYSATFSMSLLLFFFCFFFFIQVLPKRVFTVWMMTCSSVPSIYSPRPQEIKGHKPS